MSRQPILFRCDGNPESGWEPFYQCLAFATAVQRRRRGTYLFGRLEPASLALPVHRAGHEWLPGDTPLGTPDDVTATLRAARKIQAAAVIVASPNPPEGYVRELTASGLLVVTLSAASDLYFSNRLVVNPTLGVGRDRYDHDRGTQLLIGERYPLVRSIIRRLRPMRSQEPAQPFRGLVALGDDDLDGRALHMTQLLLDMPGVDRVDVAARPHHAKAAELAALAEAEPRLNVIHEVSELTTRLGRAHFAVTSGDSWSLEMACLGVPQVITLLDERCRANAQRLEEEGAATLVGLLGQIEDVDVAEAVQSLLTDPAERRGMTRAGRQLIDGRGLDRLVTAVEVMLHVGQRRAVPERLAA